VPTDTPTRAPTPTPSFTPTPAASATSTPTFTATPESLPIYLPVMLDERCAIQWVHSDVALVIDMSTNMNQNIGGGRTKLDATLDAAKVFPTMVDLTPDAEGRSDRIAVVGFNARAWNETGLTGDLGALMRDCASAPAGYIFTPDPEALAGIYAQIAYAFGCPKGRHDWGRPWS